MAPPIDAFDIAAIAAILVGLSVLVRRGIPKAYGLGVIILVVFAVQQLAAIMGHGPRIDALGYSIDGIQGGAYWTILTSMFAHAGWAHIFGNLFILLTAGPALEDRIGPRKFLLIYFAAGFAALAAHSLLAFTTSIVPMNSVAVGASGAIFGVLTTFAVRYPRERLPLILFLFVVWAPAFLVLLFYLGFNVYYMLASNAGIAWWGHFAGFLVGLPVAYTLPHTAASDLPVAGSPRGLPDPDKLAPLATTPELKRILGHIQQFSPESRTQHDAHFAATWVDKFFEKAQCANGHRFRARTGMSATCDGGETRVDFART